MSNENEVVKDSSYGNESIVRLEGAQKLRTRPETMLGSNGLDGSKHTVIEMAGNAIDEGLSGFGKKLDFCYYGDGSISIRDYGRGVPLGWNEKFNEWNYFLIYEELYAGGKYDNSQDVLKQVKDWSKFNLLDFPYLITVGLNGVGAAATQYTSKFFEVRSYRDGKVRSMKYEKGAHIWDKLKEEDSDEETGTFVHWKPDIEVFTDVSISSKWVERLCKTLSYVSCFSVSFDNCGKVTNYENQNIGQYLKSQIEDVFVTDNFNHEVDGKGDICVCFADIAIGKGGAGNEFFNNMIELNGGCHSDAINSAEGDFFTARGSERGVKIKSSDYSGKLSTIVSTLCNKASYRGQTKDSMGTSENGYVYRCIEKALYSKLEQEWGKGTDWFVDVVDEVVKMAEDRIALAEMSKNLKDVEKTIKSAKVSNKFISCDAYDDKDYSNSEFWIFEGDSAGNSALLARDSRFQCIMPVRGKSLNVFKASIEQILRNREIRDIIAAMGCGVDLGIEGMPTFDMSKLRFDKIILGADADIDGRHIDILLFLIFYKFAPEVLYEGKLYLANCPLYVIALDDNTYIYCMDESELAIEKEKIAQSRILEITRFKGLGEMDPGPLWDKIMNPETRRLTQIKIDKNDMEVYDVLEVFFGKSTDRRKKAILGSMMGTDYETTMDNIDDLIKQIEGLDINTVEFEDVIL